MNPTDLAYLITLQAAALIGAAFLGLWGLIGLLSLMRGHPPSTHALDVPDQEAMAIAASAAVALALASQTTADAESLAGKPPALVSAWQLGMRTRQMLQKSAQRNRK